MRESAWLITAVLKALARHSVPLKVMLTIEWFVI